jgi:hypothetical protein
MNIFSKFAISSNKCLLPKQFYKQLYKGNISLFRISLSISSEQYKVWGHNRFEIWFKKFRFFENFRFLSKNLLHAVSSEMSLKSYFTSLNHIFASHCDQKTVILRGYYARLERTIEKTSLKIFILQIFQLFFEILATVFELFCMLHRQKRALPHIFTHFRVK